MTLAVGADGVHLRSDDVSPETVRQVGAECRAGTPARALANATVAVSCHSLREVREAQQHGLDFVVFGPVFEKKQAARIEPAGLAALRGAAGSGIRVFALGGITLQNAPACIEAGAAGIAGIRLFQENDIGDVVRTLRQVNGFFCNPKSGV